MWFGVLDDPWAEPDKTARWTAPFVPEYIAQAMTQATALVLFSGGQDSTVCLASALDRYARVETVGFAYGQRHEVELVQRPMLGDELARKFPDWAGGLGTTM